MNYRTISTICFCFTIFSSFAQTKPVKIWDKTFGGNDYDALRALDQTNDKGFILAGESWSDQSGDKSQPFIGTYRQLDYWIVKTDSLGNKEWDKTYGNPYTDYLTCIKQTSDGKYFVGGHSTVDMKLLKLDINGNKLWEKTIGGNDSDNLNAVDITNDGGFILVGASASNIGRDKSEANKGFADYWIVKIDSSGNKIWDKTIGGPSNDIPQAIHQTSDGGYIVGGYSTSGIGGDKSEVSKGNFDYWVVKLDSNGNKIWDKTFGGADLEYISSILQTADGGYIVGGFSESGISGDKSEASRGGSDNCIIKLDRNGNKVCNKTFGGSGLDLLNDIREVHNGYILAGISNSRISSDKTGAPVGGRDFWLIKTDFSGNKLWDKVFGSGADDAFARMKLTHDGGAIVGGSSSSGVWGDKSQPSQGANDYWILKIKGNISVTTGLTHVQYGKSFVFQNYPNPFSENTLIPFELVRSEQVEITIYNQLGQEEGKLRNIFPEGNNKVFLNEIIENRRLSAGLYYYEVKTETMSSYNRMLKVD